MVLLWPERVRIINDSNWLFLPLRSPGLPVGALDHLHQLGDLAALLGLVAGRDRTLDAMGHMVAQHLLLDAAQRHPHGGNLRDNVDAIAVILDHPGKAADLAFDAPEALEGGRLDLRAHGLY